MVGRGRGVLKNGSGRTCIKFQDKWMRNPEYAAWLSPVSNEIHKAYCSMCDSKLDISSMGHQAIKGHHETIKHQETLRAIKAAGNRTRSITEYISKPQSSSAVNTYEVPCPSSYDKKQADRAIIYWVLRTVDHNNSFSSNDDIKEILEMCFPD